MSWCHSQYYASCQEGAGAIHSTMPAARKELVPFTILCQLSERPYELVPFTVLCQLPGRLYELVPFTVLCQLPERSWCHSQYYASCQEGTGAIHSIILAARKELVLFTVLCQLSGSPYELMPFTVLCQLPGLVVLTR